MELKRLVQERNKLKIGGRMALDAINQIISAITNGGAKGDDIVISSLQHLALENIEKVQPSAASENQGSGVCRKLGGERFKEQALVIIAVKCC